MYKSYQIIWEDLKSNKKKKRKTLGIETQMKIITKGKIMQGMKGTQPSTYKKKTTKRHTKIRPDLKNVVQTLTER